MLRDAANQAYDQLKALGIDPTTYYPAGSTMDQLMKAHGHRRLWAYASGGFTLER